MRRMMMRLAKNRNIMLFSIIKGVFPRHPRTSSPNQVWELNATDLK